MVKYILIKDKHLDLCCDRCHRRFLLGELAAALISSRGVVYRHHRCVVRYVGW